MCNGEYWNRSEEADAVLADEHYASQADGEGPESADEMETPLTGDEMFTAYLRNYGDTRPDGTARND